MPITDVAREKIEEALNADDRSGSHVAIGVVTCIGLIAVTSAIAALRPQPVAPGAEPTRNPVLRAVWPAIFSATTIAALRIWNAPSGPTRSRALGLWAASQALNMGLMIWRPRRRSRQLAAALGTAGLTAAYAHAAARVDEKAAALVAPTGFAGLSSLVAEPPDGA